MKQSNIFAGTECEDADPDYCADKLRYCKTPQLKDFLKTHCKKTCGYCGTKPQPTQPPKPPTGEYSNTLYCG